MQISFIFLWKLGLILLLFSFNRLVTMEDPWSTNTVHTHRTTRTVQTKQRTTEHSRWVNSSNQTEDHRAFQVSEQFKPNSGPQSIPGEWTVQTKQRTTEHSRSVNSSNQTEDHRAFQVSEQFKPNRGPQSIPGEWTVECNATGTETFRTFASIAHCLHDQ